MTATNQTTALTRLAQNIQKAEALTNHLKHRQAISDLIPRCSIERAERTEINAHQAFAVACGHQPGTPGFTQALSDALAEKPAPDDLAAVFEFVGQYDGAHSHRVLTVGQLREAAHEFARQRRA